MRVRISAAIPLKRRPIPARAQGKLERAIQIQRRAGGHDQKLIRRQRIISTAEHHPARVDHKVTRQRLSAQIRIARPVIRGIQQQRARQRLHKSAPTREQAAHRELTASAHRDKSLRTKGDHLEVHRVVSSCGKDGASTERKCISLKTSIGH